MMEKDRTDIGIASWQDLDNRRYEVIDGVLRLAR
jgi:hypothetical protein